MIDQQRFGFRCQLFGFRCQLPLTFHRRPLTFQSHLALRPLTFQHSIDEKLRHLSTGIVGPQQSQ